ncbi:hypothetical protein NDA16_000145 [Ustilago loliicola]|nr:hypothetical protein NDA16_000145 [Ustilago loliicola]
MPSAAASTSHTKSSPATLGATPPKAVAATSASTPAIKAATDHVSQPVGTVSPASAKAPVANPASKKATTTPATTTTKKATSSREQQKKPEPTVSPSLLSDCRKFETFAESSAEKRTHMASNTKLTEIMRSLNRAVLVFCTSHRYNLIYAELASLVALLNYAAAFYYVYADNMEGYMGQYLEHGDLQHLFSAVYRNRADYIETEEYRTSGSSSDGQTGYSKERAARRHVILEEFNSMVPDVTDLRDGVQTILFTFTWINYTAFQGADKAVASTLHTLIPLLQTIIVRATRQAYHLRGALIAATTKSALSEKPPPKGTDLQWDLVELSNSLQNLSGSDVALYAPIVYSKNGKKKKKKGSKKKKKAIGWPESVVSVPYIVSLYTAGVADIAYRFLNKAVSAQQSGILSEQPEKEEIKKCSPMCKCPTAEDKQKPIIDELDQRTTLVERKQRDWKPLVVKDQTSKGKKKKAKKKKQKEQREQEEEKGQQEQKKLKSPFLDCLKKMQGENSDDEYDCDICPEDGVGEILMDRFYDIATYNSRISAKAEIDKAVQRNKEVKAGAVAPTTATKNNSTPGKPAATPSKPDAVPSPKSAIFSKCDAA